MEINTLSGVGLMPLADPGTAPALRGEATGGVAATGTTSRGAALNAQQDAAPNGAPPSAGDLKAAVDSGNKALQSLNQALEFQIDDKSRQTVVKVVDTQTNEVIQQFPSQQFLQMAQDIDTFQAQLIKDKA